MTGFGEKLSHGFSVAARKTANASSSARTSLTPTKIEVPQELTPDSFRQFSDGTPAANYATVADGTRAARLLGSAEPLEQLDYKAALAYLKKPRFTNAGDKKLAFELSASAGGLHDQAVLVVKKSAELRTAAKAFRDRGRLSDQQFVKLVDDAERLRDEAVTGVIPDDLRPEVQAARDAFDADVYLGKQIADIKHELKKKIATFESAPTASVRSMLKRQHALVNLGYADADVRRLEIGKALAKKITSTEQSLNFLLSRMVADVKPASLAPLKAVLDRTMVKLHEGAEYAAEIGMDAPIREDALARLRDLHDDLSAHLDAPPIVEGPHSESADSEGRIARAAVAHVTNAQLDPESRARMLDETIERTMSRDSARYGSDIE